jgi:DNA repair protein RecN (Recombination protein N)
VSAGCEQGQVTAAFDLPIDHPAHLAARECGLTTADELVLRRVQAADGRTRAFVNDQPATAQALRAIGATLVEIHCQHDDRSLVDPTVHRDLVDAHGGLSARRSAHWPRKRRASRKPAPTPIICVMRMMR